MSAETNGSTPEEALARLMAALPRTLSVLIGKELPADLVTVLSDIEHNLPSAASFFRAVGDGKAMSDERLQKAVIRRAIDSFLGSFLEGIPPGQSPFEHLIGELERHSSPPKNIGLLADTSYLSALETLSSLVETVYSQSVDVDAYLNRVDSSEIGGTLAVGQMMTTRLAGRLKPLLRPRVRYTRKVARDCILLYEDLAGAIEKGLPLVVGLVELLNGNQPDYSEIARRSLAKNIKTMRVTAYAALAPNFDLLTVRNAIAHKSYYYEPASRRVKFEDPMAGRSEELGYRDLLIRTKGLCAIAFVLHQARFKLVLARLKEVKEFIETAS